MQPTSSNILCSVGGRLSAVNAYPSLFVLSHILLMYLNTTVKVCACSSGIATAYRFDSVEDLGILLPV